MPDNDNKILLTIIMIMMKIYAIRKKSGDEGDHKIIIRKIKI